MTAVVSTQPSTDSHYSCGQRLTGGGLDRDADGLAGPVIPGILDVMTAPLPPATVLMYTTSWCGYCVRLKGQLQREGIAFAEVNIEDDPAAAEFVMKHNEGNQTVPTVVFPDGAVRTNPSLRDVKALLGR